MSSIDKGAASAPMASLLQGGLTQLSGGQSFLFEKYVRRRSPLDGRVFVIKASLVTNDTTEGALSYQVNGMLHTSNDIQQKADESPTMNQLVFTSTTPLPFWGIPSQTDYIAKPNISGVSYLAFSNKAGTFENAGVHHYSGIDIYPANTSVIVETQQDLLRTLELTVITSYPKWVKVLSGFQVFPAFLVEADQKPPYLVVDIPTADMKKLGQTPWYDEYGNQREWVQELVNITAYGLSANEIWDLERQIYRAYSDPTNEPPFGVTGTVNFQEAYRTQEELNILAVKKTASITVNYWRHRQRNEDSHTLKEAVYSLTNS